MCKPFYNDPAFLRCLHEAAATPELVREFDRLSGTNLARRGTPLDLMIDDATGRTDDALGQFVTFVREAIYERLPQKALDDLAGSSPKNS